MARTKAARARDKTADPRYAAVLARNPSADGTFVYCVQTTGVYCRPSCGARPPRPENVGFHRTPAEAERAGFRPCKRCKPDEPSLLARRSAIVADLCRFIERAEQTPSLRELSQRAGLSPHHLHRVFRAATGLTPRAYAAAQRARRLRDELARGARVTSALYQAGYGSPGRLYAEASSVLGMKPGEYRRGADAQSIQFAVGQCSLGAILVAKSERGICAIALGDDPDELVRALEARFPHAALIGGDAEFETWVARVVGLVEAPGLGLDLPLDVRGTAFQCRVWQALQRIPAGRTVTYGELAERIGAPRSVRAVARACADNVLAVAIPCHRVVRLNGGLAGYRWGIDRKRALLLREAAQRGVRARQRAR